MHNKKKNLRHRESSKLMHQGAKSMHKIVIQRLSLTVHNTTTVPFFNTALTIFMFILFYITNASNFKHNHAPQIQVHKHGLATTKHFVN